MTWRHYINAENVLIKSHSGPDWGGITRIFAISNASICWELLSLVLWLRAANMKTSQKSLCDCGRHQTGQQQQRWGSAGASACPAPLQNGLAPARASTGCDLFWEEWLEETGLYSPAEQRLRWDVIAVYRHQRSENTRGFKLSHNFGTITNAYNKVAVNG